MIGATWHAPEAKPSDYAALATLEGKIGGASAENTSRLAPWSWTDAFPVSSPASTPAVLVRLTGKETLIEGESEGTPSETETVSRKTISRKLISLSSFLGFPFSFQFHGF